MRTIQFSSTLLLLILLISCSSNAKDPDVIILPEEHETPTIDGLKMNVYVEKKEFNLNEPINIYTMIKNKSNNVRNFSIFSFSSTSEARLHYIVLNEKSEPIEEFPSKLHHSIDSSEERLIGVDYSLNPNASILFKKDIQTLVKKPGKYQLLVHLIAFTETGILASNKIKIAVVE